MWQLRMYDKVRGDASSRLMITPRELCSRAPMVGGVSLVHPQYFCSEASQSSGVALEDAVRNSRNLQVLPS